MLLVRKIFTTDNYKTRYPTQKKIFIHFQFSTIFKNYPDVKIKYNPRFIINGEYEV